MLNMKKILLLLAALPAAGCGDNAGNEKTALPAADSAAVAAAPAMVTPLATPAEVTHDEPPAPGVLAVVHGHRITENDVRTGVEQYRKGMKGIMNQEIPADKTADLHALVLDQLINVRAVLTEAERQGITVPDAELETRLSQMEKNPAFTAMMKEMKLDRAGVKAKLRDETTVLKFMETKFDRTVDVTDGEIDDFYGERKEMFVQPARVRASHIYKKTDKAGLEALHEQILAGADFAALAKKHSEDKATAAKGGDLGFFAKGDLLPEFDRTAFVMENGQVSPVILTGIGYHLLTVTGREGEKPVPLHDAKDDIRKLLVMRKNNERLERMIRDIRKKADIRIYDRS